MDMELIAVLFIVGLVAIAGLGYFFQAISDRRKIDGMHHEQNGLFITRDADGYGPSIELVPTGVKVVLAPDSEYVIPFADIVTVNIAGCVFKLAYNMPPQTVLEFRFNEQYVNTAVKLRDEIIKTKAEETAKTIVTNSDKGVTAPTSAPASASGSSNEIAYLCQKVSEIKDTLSFFKTLAVILIILEIISAIILL